MKNNKKLLAALTAAMVLASTSVVALAAQWSTPAEAAAGVTGSTVEEVQQQRADGKTYGQIADEAGKLEEFQQAMTDIHEERLDDLVELGRITDEEADTWLEAYEERQATCDGTGLRDGSCGLGYGCGSGAGCGAGYGAGYGMGYGPGDGTGYGAGYGAGRGAGMGMGCRW